MIKRFYWFVTLMVGILVVIPILIISPLTYILFDWSVFNYVETFDEVLVDLEP